MTVRVHSARPQRCRRSGWRPGRWPPSQTQHGAAAAHRQGFLAAALSLNLWCAQQRQTSRPAPHSLLCAGTAAASTKALETRWLPEQTQSHALAGHAPERFQLSTHNRLRSPFGVRLCGQLILFCCRLPSYAAQHPARLCREAPALGTSPPEDDLLPSRLAKI
jgi:hypothetical protein